MNFDYSGLHRYIIKRHIKIDVTMKVVPQRRPITEMKKKNINSDSGAI